MLFLIDCLSDIRVVTCLPWSRRLGVQYLGWSVCSLSLTLLVAELFKCNTAKMSSADSLHASNSLIWCSWVRKVVWIHSQVTISYLQLLSHLNDQMDKFGTFRISQNTLYQELVRKTCNACSHLYINGYLLKFYRLLHCLRNLTNAACNLAHNCSSAIWKWKEINQNFTSLADENFWVANKN